MNLALNELTPQYAQAQAVSKRNGELWGREAALRINEAWRTAYLQLEATLVDTPSGARNPD